MSTTAPLEWNTDSPTTLFVPGILTGRAINTEGPALGTLKGSSGRIWISRLHQDATASVRDGEKGFVATKVVEDSRLHVPRDLRREAILLGKMNHANILPLLNAYLVPSRSISPVPTFHLFTPLYPLSLYDLLHSLSFNSELQGFSQITHSLSWQMISAVSYLHSQGIAHRDIGPGNFVVARNGRAVLIDFGISLEKGDEEVGKMHFEIGTGAYRAPELLFGTKSYDIFALDLWSLGATLAEFFTPFSLPTPPSPTSSISSSNSSGRWDESDLNLPTKEVKPSKQTLFDGSKSDFALIGSVYKIRGTPTISTWPEGGELPMFNRFEYAHQDPLTLPSLLPHLPSSPQSPILSILEGLLVISAKGRMSAKEALEDPTWKEVGVLDPEEDVLRKLIEQFIS